MFSLVQASDIISQRADVSFFKWQGLEERIQRRHVDHCAAKLKRDHILSRLQFNKISFKSEEAGTADSRRISKAWFPLSRNLYVGTHIDEIEQNRVNVWRVARTFPTRDLSYIVSDLLFTHVNCTLVRVNFHCRVHFTCENKIEAMYRRSRVNVIVEPSSSTLP